MATFKYKHVRDVSLGHKYPYERLRTPYERFFDHFVRGLLKAAVRKSSVRRPFVSSQPGRWSCPRFLRTSYETPLRKAVVRMIYEHRKNPGGGGGGGGTQIWFRRGCAAEAAKPIPIFKGHFGGKGYLLLRIFSQENDVFVYFSDEMGENYKSGGYV